MRHVYSRVHLSGEMGCMALTTLIHHPPSRTVGKQGTAANVCRRVTNGKRPVTWLTVNADRTEWSTDAGGIVHTLPRERLQ